MDSAREAPASGHTVLPKIKITFPKKQVVPTQPIKKPNVFEKTKHPKKPDVEVQEVAQDSKAVEPISVRKVERYLLGCHQIERQIRHLQASLERSGRKLEEAINEIDDDSEQIEDLKKRLHYVEQQVLIEKAMGQVYGALGATIDVYTAMEDLLDVLKEWEVQDTSKLVVLSGPSFQILSSEMKHGDEEEKCKYQ